MKLSKTHHNTIKLFCKSSNALTNEVKKTFNITPAVPGSGYTDTAINHDQRLN